VSTLAVACWYQTPIVRRDVNNPPLFSAVDVALFPLSVLVSLAAALGR
jgi:hypothetical protein